MQGIDAGTRQELGHTMTLGRCAALTRAYTSASANRVREFSVGIDWTWGRTAALVDTGHKDAAAVVSSD